MCVYVYIHMCVCVYVHIYLCMYIPKCLSTACSVCTLLTCLCVFRADHLALDNQLVCPSLGNTSFSCCQRSLVACSPLKREFLSC